MYVLYSGVNMPEGDKNLNEFKSSELTEVIMMVAKIISERPDATGFTFTVTISQGEEK